MPYKSEAQRRFFHTKTGMEELGPEEVQKWDKESKDMKKLPEHVSKMAHGGQVEDSTVKQKVLQEIKDLMNGQTAKKLGGLKKGGAIEIKELKAIPLKDDMETGPDESPAHEAMESPEIEAAEKMSGDELGMEAGQPSPEEIDKIRALYEKYCK